MSTNTDHFQVESDKPRTVEYATPAHTARPRPPLLAIVLRVIIPVVVIGLFLWMLLPSTSRPRPALSVLHCGSNLRQVGQAYQLYIYDFQAPPPDLVSLAEHRDLIFEELCCPLTDTDIPDRQLPRSQQGAIARAKPLAHISYEYIYRPIAAGPDEIIAYDRLENHTGHFSIPSDINVLFGDGRVERWKVADVKQKLQATPR